MQFETDRQTNESGEIAEVAMIITNPHTIFVNNGPIIDRVKEIADFINNQIVHDCGRCIGFTDGSLRAYFAFVKDGSYKKVWTPTTCVFNPPIEILANRIVEEVAELP